MGIEARRRTPLAVLLLVLSACMAAAQGPQGPPSETGNAEQERLGRDLDTLRERIRGTRDDIRQAQEQESALLAELESLEDRDRAALAALEDLRVELRARRERLRQLERDRGVLERNLAAERAELAKQLRIAHLVGRGQLPRLLLGLEQPRRVGRLLAYYHYLNRRRGRAIRRVREDLQRSVELRRRMDREAEQQAAREAEHRDRLAALEELRVHSAARLAKLQKDLSERHREFAALLREERALLHLLEGIAGPPREVPAWEQGLDFLPFESLRGSLQWPVAGRLTRVFGARDERSGLRSRGVVIATAPGATVHAVGEGEVVFAESFRNLGLLLILDHGGGYMSLYAHNRRLLKQPGQKVRTGEVIARGGGEDGGGLYFEIRHQGVAIDPARWCGR